MPGHAIPCPYLVVTEVVVLLMIARARHVGHHRSHRLNLLHENIPPAAVLLGHVIGHVPDMDDQVVGPLADVALQEGKARRVLIAQVAIQRYGRGPVRAGRVGPGKEEVGPALARAHPVQVVGDRLQVRERDSVDVLAPTLRPAVHE